MKSKNETIQWLLSLFLSAMPPPPVTDVAEWAEENVKLPGTARGGDSFSLRFSPWLAPVYEWLLNAWEITLVKPVQTGGSVFGEVALCLWLATSVSGDIAYYWESKTKAREKWDKRFLRIIEQTKAVSSRFPMDGEKVSRTKFKKLLITFPNFNFMMRGTENEAEVSSDSLRKIVNEEIHSWIPGRLAQVYARATAVYGKQILNISNASEKDDQLHQIFCAGTMQELEWQCPACKTWQAPHIRPDAKSGLGGLCYDAEGCRLPGGGYDYERLKNTIYYACSHPGCGHRVRDTPTERRQFSDTVRAGPPRDGADLSRRSFRYEALVPFYIPWITLIQEKHAAIRATELSGNVNLMKTYLQERECQFWEKRDLYVTKKIEVETGIRKGKAGVKDRDFRFLTFDKQAGEKSKGETKHYWAVIRDWKVVGNEVISQLCFEGKRYSDEELHDLEQEYECVPWCVAGDSGYDTNEVLRMCFRFGGEKDLGRYGKRWVPWLALKGAAADGFPHKAPDGKGGQIRVQKLWSPMEYAIIDEGKKNRGRHAGERVGFVKYSLQGILSRLVTVRSAKGVQWITPVDVSEDYHRHSGALVEVEKKLPDGRTIMRFDFRGDRYDLLMCDAYQVLMADIAGVFSRAANA